MIAQLPLALRYPPDQCFDTFVAAPDGAIAQLRALSTGGEDAVCLVGAAATGKTHLALATCASTESNFRSAVYLPLAPAAGRLRDALEALHDRDLIAIDGIDAIAGDRDDEIALFDFHNRVRDAGKALVYASRATPAALPFVLPDLRSRLSQCVRITLTPLDDAGRRDLLRLRAARRGLQIDDTAIDWLLTRVDRDLASLAALLDQLDHASLAAQRRITLPFLRQLLDTELNKPR